MDSRDDKSHGKHEEQKACDVFICKHYNLRNRGYILSVCKKHPPFANPATGRKEASPTMSVAVTIAPTAKASVDIVTSTGKANQTMPAIITRILAINHKAEVDFSIFFPLEAYYGSGDQ